MSAIRVDGVTYVRRRRFRPFRMLARSTNWLIMQLPFAKTIRLIIIICLILAAERAFFPENDVPYVPFVACEEPVGGVRGIAYEAGEKIHELRTEPPKPEAFRAFFVDLAEDAGTVVGGFSEAVKGAERPVETVRPQPEAGQQIAGCSPCPSTLTPVDADPSARGIMLAANAALTTPWTREQAIEGVAVAGAESDYVEDVVNPLTIDGSNATGLWQTMMPMHADLYDGGDPKDAYDNAAVAYKLWKDDGGSFSSPWAATYGAGLHEPYMARAEAAVDRVLAQQSQSTRATLASIELGMGGQGCDPNSTVPIGDVGARVWPTEGQYVDTTNGYNTNDALHGGVDITKQYEDDLGDPIVAVEGGTIACAGDEGDCGYSGKTVMIQGPSNTAGCPAVYTHMNETPLVEEGDKVVTGQLLGYIGSTGNSSGPHLHIESNTCDGSFSDTMEWLPHPSTYPGIPGALT